MWVALLTAMLTFAGLAIMKGKVYGHHYQQHEKCQSDGGHHYFWQKDDAGEALE
jgi:hypothetical protein